MNVDPTPLIEALDWLIQFGYALAFLPVQIVALYLAAVSVQRLGDGIGKALTMVFTGVIIGLAGLGACGFLLIVSLIGFLAWKESRSA